MKLAVGFIAYNESTSQYLPYFLSSLFQALSQTGAESRVWCIDNSDLKNNDNEQFITANYHWIQYHFSGENVGFAKAYNQMITAAKKWGADYFLMINPDTYLDPQSLRWLVDTLNSNNQFGAVAPRLLRWNFSRQELTDRVDSDGIAINTRHAFSDKHQGEKVSSLAPGKVFGASGAAALFNMRALIDIAFLDQFGQTEYLDEMFFMYKEDIDLSYRLQLAGWPIWLEPRAIIYHDRRARARGLKWWWIVLNRPFKSRQIKAWSFYGQNLLFAKYLSFPFSPQIKRRSRWYQFQLWVFALLFEPYLLGERRQLKRQKEIINWHREAIKVKIPLKNIEKMMFDND